MSCPAMGESYAFYAPVSVWSVIEWMMSHAMGSFEEGNPCWLMI